MADTVVMLQTYIFGGIALDFKISSHKHVSLYIDKVKYVKWQSVVLN
jgi:hypothetical protein